MKTRLLTRHRRKLYVALAFCIIVHTLNFFVLDKYFSQFAFSSFWLLIFPGFVSLYLIFAIVFEITLRKRRNPTVSIIEYIFWGLLTGGLTFLFLFSLWYFGGLKYVFHQLASV
jgi:VIT1/CCC1 family predicted Fe2+/Mn2+ transporter